MAQPLDQHYTPQSLAEDLVNLATVEVRDVADFASGSGNLLAAAAVKWPDAELYANDVDAIAVSAAASRLNLCGKDQLDFLSPHFHAHQSANGRTAWSLVLLNPPFSQRETITHAPIGIYGNLRCSRAMAFVLTAVQYVADGGQLLAILPTSTLLNNLDKVSREILWKDFSAEIVRRPEYGLFAKVDVSTYVLRVTRRSTPENTETPIVTPQASRWNIIRGSISMARNEREQTPADGWVHTTGLRLGTVGHRYGFNGEPYGKVAPRGSVILPRVGRFHAEKIVIVTKEDGEHISDCILAIQGADIPPAVLRDTLIKNFTRLVELYGGTGAPYIAKDRLKTFLNDLIRTS